LRTSASNPFGCGSAAICHSGDAQRTLYASRRVWQFACPACGEFEITDQGEEAIRYDPTAKDLRHLVSAATRRGSDLGQPVLIKSDNWRGYAEAFLGISVVTKLRTLLEFLRKRSEFFGSFVEFAPLTDWPLLVANGPEEGQAILQHAYSRNLVARQTGTQWALTWDGWEAVEPTAGSMIDMCITNAIIGAGGSQHRCADQRVALICWKTDADELWPC
jgi:hypothetical protein